MVAPTETNKQFLVYHPIALAIYIIVFLFSHNASQLEYGELFLPSICNVVLAVSVLGFIHLLINNKQKSPLLTSGFVPLFFSYGHVLTLGPMVSFQNIGIHDHRHLLPIFLIIFCILTVVLLKLSSNWLPMKSIRRFLICRIMCLSSLLKAVSVPMRSCLNVTLRLFTEPKPVWN